MGVFVLRPTLGSGVTVFVWSVAVFSNRSFSYDPDCVNQIRETFTAFNITPFIRNMYRL